MQPYAHSDAQGAQVSGGCTAAAAQLGSVFRAVTAVLVADGAHDHPLGGVLALHLLEVAIGTVVVFLLTGILLSCVTLAEIRCDRVLILVVLQHWHASAVLDGAIPRPARAEAQEAAPAQQT